jgi:hypothetical protein
MSRLAHFCLTLFQRLYHLTSTRPLILFGLAVALACLSANGEATAQILFQSPESPIGPGFGAPQSDQPVAPQEPAPVEQPAGDPSALPAATPPAPEQAGAEPAPPQPAPSSRRGESEDRFAGDETEEDSNFILDQAEFIDTVVVSTAYAWLCCGIIVFLLIPLAFLFLQIRGRTKISREEPY